MRLVTTFYSLALVCLPLSLQAQMTLPDNTNATVRQLSRIDCIALALEHNLDIRISRHDPRIAYYNLRGAYAYYEPTFALSASQRFDKTESSLILQTNEVPGSRGFNNDVTGSFLNARTPFGSQLTLDSSWNHAYGRVGTFNEHPAGPLFPPTVSSASHDSYSGTVSVLYRQDLLKDFWINANRLTIQLNKRGIRVSEYRLEDQVIQTVAATEAGLFQPNCGGGTSQSCRSLFAAQ